MMKVLKRILATMLTCCVFATGALALDAQKNDPKPPPPKPPKEVPNTPKPQPPPRNDNNGGDKKREKP